MTDEPIPPELRDFILRYVDSVAQLEALLLLYLEKSTTWSATKLSKRLYIRTGEAEGILARLLADGFATPVEGGYSFSSKSSEQEHLLEQLGDAYSTRLIPLTNLIHSKPARIREFSDAFKIRKDPT